MGLIAALIVGGIAGWLAGIIVKGSGHGVIMNIVIGIIGAFIGGFLFSLAGFGSSQPNLFGSIAVATLGAVVLLWIANKIKT